MSMFFYRCIWILFFLFIGVFSNAQPEKDIAALEAEFKGFPESGFDPLTKAAVADQMVFEYILRNDLETALRYNKISEKLKVDSPELNFIPNYRHLGLIYTRMRQFPRARLYLEMALKLSFQENNRLNQARLYADQGDWCYRLGDFDQAAENYHRSLDLFETLPEQYVNQAFVHMALGAVYFEKGSPGRASIEYETAGVMLVKKYGENHISLVPLLTGEGKSLMEYGDFVLAESRLISALSVAEEHYGENHPETAKALINLAVLELKLEKTNQARKFADLASRILTEKPSAFTERGVLQDQLLRLKEVQAYILLNQFSGSKEENYLVLADSMIQEGLAILDNALQGFSFEMDRMNFVKSHQSLYELALAIEKAKWDGAGSKNEVAEAAFRTIERNKAQVLNSLIHDVQVKKFSGIPEDLIQKEQKLKTRVTEINTDRALLTPEDPAFASLSEELLLKENDYESFIKQLEQDYPEFFRLRYRKTQITIEKIRSVMDDDDAMISYYLEDLVYHIFYIDKSNVEWFTFDKDVVFEGQETFKDQPKFKIFKGTIFGKKKGPDIQTIPVPTRIIDSKPSYPLDDAIRFYTKSIRKFEKDLFARSGRSLYQKLIFPIEDLIKNKKHLVIIPDGELHYVPFEALLTDALPDGKPVKYTKFPYLVKNYSISYHHSAGLYYETRVSVNENSKTFVGFAPIFNDSLRNGWVWNSKDYMRDTTYFSDYSNLRSISISEKRKFKELKFSKDEVVSIAKLFARSERDSEVFLHGEASEENFKAKAGAASIVHVASHSFVDYINPEGSGLAFALNEKASNEDGILYSPETFNLNLSADLLVLSSCESGAGKIAEGEGLLSLTRGFLFSGVRNALVSLWRISDRTTSRFMVEFYKAMLTEGESYQDALRSAKLKSINNEKTAAPRYWCSFVLVGKGR